MMGIRPSKQDTLAFILLLLGVIWFGREMITTNQVPFFRDMGPFFYPMRFLLAESFKAGELPLWDRHMAMGFPLLANFQSGAFYPPNLLYLLLPFFTAVKAVYILHYLISAAGCYLLCRHWKFPPYLSIVGGLLFTLGGTIVSLSNLLNHFQTAVWLPWVILAGERAMGAPSRRTFLTFCFLSLAQFLAGSPELYLMSIGLLVLDLLRLKREGVVLPYRKSIGILIGANLLVVGLAMVQVLPTAELFLQSRGPTPLPYWVASAWSLRPVSLVNIFFPYGEVDTSLFSGLRLFFRNDIPLLVSHYLGVISLFGLCIWCFTGTLKGKSIYFGLLAASLLLAFGGHTPLYSWLHQFVPLFSLFRFPEKFFFITHALLVFAAVMGLFTFTQKDFLHRRGTMAALYSICAVLVLLYLFTNLELGSVRWFISWVTGTPLNFKPMLDSISGALYYLERQVVLAIGLLLLLVLWKKGKLRSALFQPLIVVLVFIDLNSANRPFQYLLDPGFVYNGNSAISARDSEHQRIFYYPDPKSVHPSHYVVHKGQTFADLNSVIVENMLPNTGVIHGFDYMQEIDALRRWPYRVFVDVANGLPPERQYRLFGALNVRYIISLKEIPPGELSLVRHLPEYPSWIYRLNSGIPRSYIVSQASRENDPVKIVTRLSRLDFDPLKEVILEKAVPVNSNGHFQSKSEIVHYGDQSVTIDASLSEPGFLVLADSYYPGWRAYVDGEESEILRANLFFRAVSLPAGEHRVEFRYQPLSFILGLAISLTTALGVIGWMVVVHFNPMPFKGWIERGFFKVRS